MAVSQCHFRISIVHATLIIFLNITDHRTRYKHIITGSIGTEPNDMLGGIIADGMGLGKTLTMIASIISSLSRADQFVKGSASNGQTGLVSVMSTLIIVPSASECLRLVIKCLHAANQL